MEEGEEVSESNDFRHPKKAAFLAAYAELGNVTHAARTAEIDRSTHYEWLESDAEYRERFRVAHEEACDSLEHEARRRAVTGTLKPVFYKGKRCGSIREYSDTLLIFLMKGALPDKYRERSSVDVSVPGAVEVKFVDDWNGQKNNLPAASEGVSASDPE